jgi:ADP-ribose pyrophosphatase YjhB (NUDIX family)
MNKRFLDKITRLKALADTGLLYAANDYDKERYTELLEISFELLSTISNHPIESLKTNFPLLTDYPTAKVDIRGVLLSADKKILLVKESTDGNWSLPGGWADVGFSPKETVVKEFKEETGLDISVQRLLAVMDTKMHAHPPQPFYVYKMIFLCEALSNQINKGFDVLDVQYFDIDNLPLLSEERILKPQIELLYQKITSDNFDVYVD